MYTEFAKTTKNISMKNVTCYNSIAVTINTLIY